MNHPGRKTISRNILVDGNNIIHRIFHVTKNQEPKISHGLQTGLISGVLGTLGSWLRKTPDRGDICFFLDGKPVRRLELDPDYKKDRDRESIFKRSTVSLPDGFVAQSDFDVLIHILGLLGVKIFWHPEEEADDLISSYVKNHPEDQFLIISSDRDFYQLISDKVIQYRPGAPGNNCFYDTDRVYSEGFKGANVTPDKVRLYRALTGDTSDKIPGVPKLRKTVAAQLSQFLEPTSMYASGLHGCSLKERSRIQELKNRVELNYVLLGFRHLKEFDKCELKTEKDHQTAEKILDYFNIHDVDISPYLGTGKPKTIITSDSLIDLNDLI
jgi:5'-3' exonuclease